MSWLIFPSESGIIAIMFTAIASLPFIRKVIDIEEKVEENAHSLKQLFFRNKKIIEIFSFFFLGIVITYFFSNLILPEAIRNILFAKQTAVFRGNNLHLLGNFVNHKGLFSEIFVNNLKILLFCMILSLLYGSGGLIILIWNASTLGVFISSLGKLSKIISVLPYAALEFIAFFLAAIAGGILSVGIEKHKLKSKVFKRILKDSILLFMISFILITLAAFLEVSILL